MISFQLSDDDDNVIISRVFSVPADLLSDDLEREQDELESDDDDDDVIISRVFQCRLTC